MFKLMVATGFLFVAIVSPDSAQTKKPAATKVLIYDLTIRADTVYTGTMEMTVERGKVTGNMLLTSPSEITGKVAGTEKKGVLTLTFPYYMTENKCEGSVTMNITLPSKPDPATGTMEAAGCGIEPNDKLRGMVELVPSKVKQKPQ